MAATWGSSPGREVWEQCQCLAHVVAVLLEEEEEGEEEEGDPEVGGLAGTESKAGFEHSCRCCPETLSGLSA